MSALRQSLEDYLDLRRSVGYKLDSVGRILASFVAFAEHVGQDTITTELALSWAAQPQLASPIWVAHRLSAVRGFARYLHALDPATEIPPAGLLAAPGYQPAPPYLSSDDEIAALLAAARQLTPPLRAATFETLLGLLAVTGLRIGEAMRLDRDHVDWQEKVLVVVSSKFGRSREVTCHDSTIEALRTYAVRRDQLCPGPSSASFFVSPQGRRLTHHSVYTAFRPLARQAGLAQRPGSRPARVERTATAGSTCGERRCPHHRGVLHPAADEPKTRQPAHHRGLPRRAAAAARVRPGPHRQDPLTAGV
jgi:integrase